MEKKNDVSRFDLESDDSITKFVNPGISFFDKEYIPVDLESLESEYIIDTKWNAQLTKEAKIAFEKMAWDFFNDFQKKISVVSTYRSYEYQLGIKSRGCPDALCAKAGHSEHQSGLSIDLWSASTEKYWKSREDYMSYYAWLSENAHTYGFHNTYQKWRSIDGYEIEPWHWRYLWVDLATHLKEKDITFAEFYMEHKKKDD